MPDINPSIPIIGQPDSTEEPKIVTALSQLVAAVDNVDTDQIADGTIAPVDMSSGLLDQVGVTAGAVNRRGKSIIATTETRTNVAFGLMPTPDKVTVNLPTDGLIAVMFQATWNETVNGAAQAAIFIDGNIAKVAQGGLAAPVGAAALCSGDVGIDTPLSTGSGGLMGVAGTGLTAYTGDVTTGQIVGNASFEASVAGSTGAPAVNAPIGGPCYIFAAAGTHDVSVRFLATSGTVTVKNRKLWVWTIGF